jgi:hypothetical protein
VGTLFSQSEHVVACDLDGGKALLDLRESQYYKLNPTAALVWDKISVPSTLDDIVEMITERFEVDVDRCRADITSIIKRFHDSDMIEVDGASNS